MPVADPLNSPLEQKLSGACRKLREYCNRMDRDLTTSEIVAALLRTLASEIVTDANRNNMDAARVAADYGALLRNTITALDGAMPQRAPR